MADVEYSKDGHVAVVTLNRPEHMNAINRGLLVAMAEAFIEFRDDPDAFVAVLTGAGRGFCSGLDLKEARRAAPEGELALMDISPLVNPFWDGFKGRNPELKKPVIAAVNGWALGGGLFLAAAADLALAAESARFELVVSRGLPAGWDTGLRLGLSLHASLELALGERMDAQRAYDVGLVNKVVPDDRLLEEALALAGRLASRPPLAIRANLELVRAALPTPSPELQERFLELFEAAQESEDAKESVAAFLEKRSPVFKGR
jgi:enoyl-CoA hydratase/carnithine racemase